MAFALAMIIGAPPVAIIATDRLRDGAPVLLVAAGLAAFALLHRSTLPESSPA